MKEILTTAERLGLSPLEVVERIHDRKIPDIKPPLKRKTAQFVAAVRSLRELVKAVGATSISVHASHSSYVTHPRARRLLH